LVLSSLQTPSTEELAQKQHVADSIAKVNRAKNAELIKSAQALEKTAQLEETAASENVTTETSNSFDELKNKYDLFANAATGNDELYILENELIKMN